MELKAELFITSYMTVLTLMTSPKPDQGGPFLTRAFGHRARAMWAAALLAAVSLTSCGLFRGPAKAAGAGHNDAPSRTSGVRGGFKNPLAATPTFGGTLTWDFSSPFSTLDPARWQGPQDEIPMEAIYSTLVRYGKGTSKIVPGLASYTVSPDGLTYTFTLRAGALFSNGDPITSSDVKWSLDRVASPSTGAQGPSPYRSLLEDIAGFSKLANGHATGLSGITVTSPLKLEIKLQKPQAYFLKELALPAASIVDPKVVKAEGSAFALHPVGSGPYEVASWTPGEQLVLQPNPQYNGADVPYLQKIVFNVNVPVQKQYGDFNAGKVDILSDLSPGLLQTVSQRSSLSPYLHAAPANAIWYLALNTQKPPFNNLDVRTAANEAMDKQAVLALAAGQGTLMTQPLPPAFQSHDPSLTGYSYDPSAAKALLAQSGVTDLSVTYAYSSSRPMSAAVAKIVKTDLEKVGFTVTLKNIAPTASYFPFTNSPQNGWNISWSSWWQDFPDAQDFLYNLLDGHQVGSVNRAAFKNQAFDKLVEEADALPASQEAKRVSLYRQAEAIWFKQAPWIPLLYPNADALVQPWVGPANLGVFLNRSEGVPQVRYLFALPHPGPNGRS